MYWFVSDVKFIHFTSCNVSSINLLVQNICKIWLWILKLFTVDLSHHFPYNSFTAATILPINDGFQGNAIRDESFKSKNSAVKKSGSRKSAGRGRSLSRSRYVVFKMKWSHQESRNLFCKFNLILDYYFLNLGCFIFYSLFQTPPCFFYCNWKRIGYSILIRQVGTSIFGKYVLYLHIF